MSEADHTPLMRQYREIKAKNQEAILFFRVGDFYEMFCEDAEEASQLLDIVLTSRGKNKDIPIPLCGVPYHAATGYIAKLLKAGRTVALCEQVEDPKTAKGLVRREVVRLYTPGTLFDSELLPSNESNFLAAISGSPSHASSHSNHEMAWGLATLEMSTGEFWIIEFPPSDQHESLIDELGRLEPRELIHPSSDSSELQKILKHFPDCRLVPQKDNSFDLHDNQHLLSNHFHVKSTTDLGISTLTRGIEAAGGLLRYIQTTQPNISHDHIQKPRLRSSQHEMTLDTVTIRNLELVHSFTGKQDGPTLYKTLNATITAMGGRLLKQWILRPLVDLTDIHARLEIVQEFVTHLRLRGDIRQTLRHIQDFERLNSRITLGVASPRDVLGLHRSLEVLPMLHELMNSMHSSLAAALQAKWDTLEDIKTLIHQTMDTEVTPSSNCEGVIRDGYNQELDELRKVSKDGLRWIAELETREKNRTGIESLKVKYNRVFGYYIEVTKTHLAKIPQDYARKQTLVNAERFTTEELTHLEDRITGADQKIRSLESSLFEELKRHIAGENKRIQHMAQTIAQLDVFAGLAECAALNRYVRPNINEGGTIEINEGRHPVIEHARPDRFIPNDTQMDLDQNRLLLITGPNMAGKSTYLRQVALIVMMAQMGSFVPATSAKIGLVDRVFTRIGAADDLASGQSTFMVEMAETSRILSSATPRSLILLDEVGRGTSTYDGLSLAWAIAEYILDRRRLGARTLFATHYHEMTQLEEAREGLKNYTVSIKEKDQEVLFLRKIIRGKADRSYGIHVAKLAGLPDTIIQRAISILFQLETESSATPSVTTEEQTLIPDSPPSHVILEEVKQMDLFGMTPLEALNRLADIKRRLETQEKP
ncbi:MAG: DNA mismatch repair protein MutS [Nitrospirales bacterium]|nr:DNA mismatch repair protein MutS [Nitrospira sp.]MDR4501580.1 DNA mismatch repair protein MutS [Nitrospirales bacterium]